MAYATLAELKQMLGITGTGQDAELQTWLDAARALVDNYTGSIFEPVTETRVFDYQAPSILWLDRPLHALDSVVNGDGSTFAASELRTMPLSGPPFLWLETTYSGGATFSAGTSGGQGAISVTGTWGHLDGSGNTPEPIRRATLMLAAWLYNKRGYGGVSKYRTAETGIEFTDGIPVEVETILQGYRFPMLSEVW